LAHLREFFHNDFYILAVFEIDFDVARKVRILPKRNAQKVSALRESYRIGQVSGAVT
jgi:hypothetical protein